MMYRQSQEQVEVFLVHPGGPSWARMDKGAWSIPKGEYKEDEPPLEAAIREFHEETGFSVSGELLALGTVKQAGGKLVTAWAFKGDCDPENLVSNTFLMEWPPRSKQQIEFPEVDRGGWFSLAEAKEYILPAQEPLLHRLGGSINAKQSC